MSTEGVPGIPVLLENRPIGVTDHDGLLLVDRLNAWQSNQLSVDPLRSPVDLRIESVQFTFRTLSGVRRRVNAHVADVVDGRLRHMVSLDRTFFDAAKDSPVNLEAEWYLTQYGNARSVEVPLDGTPVYASGPGQCGVVAGYSHRYFFCRSAFRSLRHIWPEGPVLPAACCTR